MKFVGQSISGRTVTRHLVGKGRFVDDLKSADSLYCAFVRSPQAHAKIKNIEASGALNNSHVVDVITGAELKDHVKPQVMQLPPVHIKQANYTFLAQGRARFMGEPVAAVIATNRYEAEDAVEQIVVDYEPLPVVVNAEKSLEKGAPLLYPEWGDNLMVKWEYDYGDVDGAFSQADKVLSRRLEIQRYAGTPIETRGILAEYDPSNDLLTLQTSKQDPHPTRALLAAALSMREQNIRVIAPDVGGGFGVKLNLFSEDVIIPYAAKKLKRPVKWIETRSEHLAASTHAREMIHYVEIAMKNDGRILGVKDRSFGDMGGYSLWPHAGAATAYVAGFTLPGPYGVANIRWEVNCAVTNKCPLGAYRGFGQPEGTFVMERMVDIAAKELRIDRVTLRIMNLVKNFPHVYANGQLHETGDYVGMLEKSLALIDYDSWQRKKAELWKEGKCIGIGLSVYPEVTACSVAGLPGGALEGIDVEIDEQGKITINSGASEIGTDITTIIAQVAADNLGVDVSDIRVNVGDTQSSPFSLGLWGSRGAVSCGSAVRSAAQRLQEKVLKIASHIFEARLEDLVIEQGLIYVKGLKQRSMSLKDVAWIAYNEIPKLPEDVEPGLSATSYYIPSTITGIPDKDGRLNVVGSMASAVHAVVVEVDVESGAVKILDYGIAHDCGVEINPANVFGQVLGGTAQGVGGALFEEFAYNESGQLLSSTFIDYLIPSSMEMPNVKVHSMVIPAQFIPGGVKGTGENGIIGPPAVIANAVDDALSDFGIEVIKTPMKPEYVWSLLQKSHV